MLRRTPLRSRKTLRRKTWLRARSKTNSYRLRERDTERMLWTKRQPCMVRELPPFLFVGTPEQAAQYKATPCSGRVEADHMGERGMGQKADDSTVVPMCKHHHAERHNHKGVFFTLTKPELRAWRAQAIERAQAAWSKR